MEGSLAVPFLPKAGVIYSIIRTSTRSHTKQAASGCFMVKQRIRRGPSAELTPGSNSMALTTTLLEHRNMVCSSAATPSSRINTIKRVNNSSCSWNREKIMKRKCTHMEQQNLLFVFDTLGDFKMQIGTCSGDLQFKHSTGCVQFGKLNCSSHEVATTKNPHGDGCGHGGYLWCACCDALAHGTKTCLGQRVR